MGSLGGFSCEGLLLASPFSLISGPLHNAPPSPGLHMRCALMVCLGLRKALIAAGGEKKAQPLVILLAGDSQHMGF